MIDREQAGVRAALCRWFESQQISTKDSAVIMMQLLAVFVVSMAPNEKDLEIGLDCINKDVREIAIISHRLLNK